MSLLPIVAVLALAGVAQASDRPVSAGRLLLRDATHRRGAAVRIEAKREPTLVPGSLTGDPRQVGALLEIVGGGPGDGSTGYVPLPPEGWTALGPFGAPTGFEYLDPAETLGIRRVRLETAPGGGSLRVSGNSAELPYRITQAQTAIDFRLTIGADVFCARATSFAANGPSRVVARKTARPAVCPPRVARCGNGIRDVGEDCDDGNADASDGCAPDCRLVDAAAACAGSPVASGDALAVELVTDQLDSPVFVGSPPLDPRRLFVVEQEGRIRVIEDGVLLSEPFLAIDDLVSCCGERGLFSIAFDPDYAVNRRFFVSYTDNQGRVVLARFKTSEDPNRARRESRRIVLRIPQPFPNHNGGQLAFGPDGYLYMGTGDGGSGGDPQENAQNPTSLLGKLLRIDVSVRNRPFRRVPPDNPNPGAGPKLGLIWASGLRNPWRFSFDRSTGDLYVADVGQNAREEVNATSLAASRGANYGWDIFEGSACFEPEPPATSCPPGDGFVFPVLEYPHPEGCSVSGGYVYRGCTLPDLSGTYFYSDFCTPFVRTFRGFAGGVAQEQRDRTAELAPGGGRSLDEIVSFGEDARGELYIVDRDGELYRIVPGG